MPVVDMPLEQLRMYTGTNPMPHDFDEFWGKRMHEVQQIELEYQLIESEITGYEQCAYHDLWFKGMTGARRYAKYVKPKISGKHPVILQFHGYPGSSRSWFEQTSFAGMGFSLIALDCPGQGGKSEDLGGRIGTTVAGHLVNGLDGNPEDMYYVQLAQDMSLLCRIIEQLEDIDVERIYANGASQGAGLALICTALNPIIKRCAALYPFLSDYKRVWEMDLDQIAYEGIRYYSRWFDPMQTNEEEVFTKLGYVDVHNFAHLIKAQILFGTGLMDNICPPSTQFAIYNRLNCQKEHVIFPDYTHEEISFFDDLLIDFFLKEVR